MRDKNDWSLFRVVISAYPGINIYSRQASKTTALGAIMVATVANKVWGWRVEVIDENNYGRGPKDKNGLPDHMALQKENPAAVVGFYCGLTSTIERVWQLAKFYRQQGVATIAGGWHTHYCPEETLQHNIDVVVHGDGEIVIQQILNALKQGDSWEDIPGISFMKNGQIKFNLPEMLENPDLNDLPFPDFGLLKYARMKIYPIGRIRGCSMNCEFCIVKGKPRWASTQHLFDTVKWLVETRRARHFFIVDDRSEEDLEEGGIFPLELVSWSKYDGSYPCFKPDNMSVRELQEVAIKLMSRFYNPWSFIGIPLRTISFPIDYFIRGRKHYWYREVIKYGGHLLIQRWRKKQEKDKFMERLEKY